eukprot:TRINITY_DN14304_c0_g1_i1.p1 TRINITY_DN14304_c0_g1~~TRINITY_DN14304_c0_g1_i1.p1  ORF type:complete len:160 (-),score=49.00 TRINITY_DN14304_c0_g1_i1:49-480(-)
MGTVRSGGPAHAVMVGVHIQLEDGDDFDLDVAASSTVHELKEAIQQETGVVPIEQQLFCLGFPLEEGDSKITELMEVSQTFNLVLPDEDADKGFFRSRFTKLGQREAFILLLERRVTRCIWSVTVVSKNWNWSQLIPRPMTRS